MLALPQAKAVGSPQGFPAEGHPCGNRVGRAAGPVRLGGPCGERNALSMGNGAVHGISMGRAALPGPCGTPGL